MRIESVRDLKQELLSEVVVPFSRAASARPAAYGQAIRVSAVARALAESSTFAVGASPLPQITDVHRSVALGIGRRGRAYHLAVRVQRQALLESPLLEHIVTAAAGEVEVRFIGRVDKRSETRGDDSGAEALPSARKPKHTRTRQVVFVGTQAITGHWHCQNVRPLLIGASIGHSTVTAGTLGGFVRRGTRVYILSNNHVLADEDRASAGDGILQRATADGGRDPDDRVGTLRHTVRLKKDGANFVDAALADIQEGVEYDAVRLREISGADQRLSGLGPELPDVDELVYKIGRTTGPTAGRVTAFDLDNVVVSYGMGNIRFDGQVEIEGIGTRAFSDGGDSGALVVNERMEAVGLLFAGGDVGGTNGRGLTYANPIRRVLQDLRAKLLA
jgi:S1-C subfamily serine protease